ncbi:MAG: type II toxin-antitoxin system VapC family toxin [Balneola sp.]|jgi:predicted nucleic acid-binding protein
MKNCIIDASIAAKWIFYEKDSDQAEIFLKKIDRMLVPYLFLIEMSSIISKKVRKRELSISEALEKRKELEDLNFQVFSEKAILKLAFDISVSLPITIYDANYLALAIKKEGKLYTSDNRLVNGLSTTVFKDYVENPL